MDRQHIRDEHVIERYLNGKLSAAEEQAFEEAYLADPELLAELELAERMQQGFKDLGPAERAPRAVPRPAWLRIASSPSYGIAASLVAAAALLTSGVLLVGGPGGGAGSGAAARHTRLLPLVSVRGSSNPNVFDAPAGAEWTVLVIDTGFSDYDRYSAALVRAGQNEPVLELDGLVAGADGTVAFGLPGELLRPGDYEVRLSGAKSDWPPGRAPDELSRTPLAVSPAR
jgi:hypothetical protein